MENLSQYIEWFRHSSSYINMHRKKVFVVLLPGEALADENFTNIVHDISLLHSLGVKLVLVHGARPQISETLVDADIALSYHKGLRITDPDSLQLIKKTVGALSIDLDARFSMGLANSPMHGADIKVSRGNFITARPLGVIDGVDYSLTGVVRRVNATAIQQHLDKNNIVLLSNLGYSPTGEVFNLSAEDIATEVAISMNAEKLILFIPQGGVMRDDQSLASTLSPVDGQRLLEQMPEEDPQRKNGVRESLAAAVKASSRTVHRCHLINFASNGALIEELFTRDGNGTLVSRDNFELLRQAVIDDVGGILELIAPLEEAGILVHRSRELLEAEIEYFKVIELEGTIIACAAIYPLDENTGEISCIAIHRDYQESGRGDHLLRALEREARKMGLGTAIVLTTQTAHWFLERGFEPIAISDLPIKKQELYNYQRKSKAFSKRLS
jgi:amino-acid N-acetyltransferase